MKFRHGNRERETESRYNGPFTCPLFNFHVIYFIDFFSFLKQLSHQFPVKVNSFGFLYYIYDFTKCNNNNNNNILRKVSCSNGGPERERDWQSFIDGFCTFAAENQSGGLANFEKKFIQKMDMPRVKGYRCKGTHRESLF